jgi:hypothetical protein
MSTDLPTWRITVASDDELHPEGGAVLHGIFIGNLDTVKAFAVAMKPWGLVIASPMDSADDQEHHDDDHDEPDDPATDVDAVRE